MNATTKIRFSCPYCGRGITSSYKASGRKANCPTCQKLLRVPGEVQTSVFTAIQDNPQKIVPKYKQRCRLRNLLILGTLLLLTALGVYSYFPTISSVTHLNHSGVLLDYLKNKADDPEGLEIVNTAEVKAEGDYSCVNIDFRAKNRVGAKEMHHGQAHIKLGKVGFFVSREFIRLDTVDLTDYDLTICSAVYKNYTAEGFRNWMINERENIKTQKSLEDAILGTKGKK